MPDRPAAPSALVAEAVSGAPVGASSAEVTGGPGAPVARFRYDVLTHSWWWSEGLYAVYGFEPGEVVPSNELIRFHHVDGQQWSADEVLSPALADGCAFSLQHRILDTRGVVRTLLTVGEGDREDGEVVAVRGYVVDVTEVLRTTVAAETSRAVERSALTRAVIEQAKGIVMATCRTSADEAFALLRRRSQVTNVKVRDLAAQMVRAVSLGARTPARRDLGALDDLLVEVDPRESDAVRRAAGRRTPGEADCGSEQEREE